MRYVPPRWISVMLIALSTVNCRELLRPLGIDRVTVSPSSPTVLVSETLRFSAAVAGSNSDHRVRWRAGRGTIDSAGLYTAPADPTLDTVFATSSADSTKSGFARVSVVTGIDTVFIAPPSAILVTGDSLRFSATVTGLNSNRAVRWSTVRGTMDSTGLYTAPGAPGQDTVKATSVSDPSKTATAVVTTTDEPLLLWTTYFPYDRGYLWGVVVDRDENIIAAGTVYNSSGGDARAKVVSTDRRGLQRWTYTFDRTADARSIVLGDNFRSVMVTGIAGVYPAQLPLLFVLDSAGNKLREGVCNNMVGGAFLSATRDANRVYLSASPPAIVTSDLSGNLDCASPIDAAVTDVTGLRVISAASPLDGTAVIAGDRRMSNQCWTAGLYTFVQQVNGASQPVWRLDLESTISPGSAAASPVLAVADEAGQRMIYLAVAWAGCGGTNDNERYMTAKMDAGGNLVWVDRWNGDNGPTSCEAYPYAVVPDPRGGVVVAGMGSTDCQTAWDCAVVSYTPNGSRRWTMTPAFKGNRNNACSAATMSSSGRYLYVVGQTGPTFSGPQELFVAKYALPQ